MGSIAPCSPKFKLGLDYKGEEITETPNPVHVPPYPAHLGHYEWSSDCNEQTYSGLFQGLKLSDTTCEASTQEVRGPGTEVGLQPTAPM